MGFNVETGPQDEGLQTTRVVTDVINNCNLGCHYCHPMMDGWGGEALTAEQVGGVLQAAEDRSMLEVTLTGGEITMHPEFDGIMGETHRLGQTALSMVTNATKITPQIVKRIGDSRVDRVCEVRKSGRKAGLRLLSGLSTSLHMLDHVSEMAI